MPTAPPRACPRCGKAGCTEHGKRNTHSRSLYQSRQWRRDSRLFLEEDPVCEDCGKTLYFGPSRKHPRKAHCDHRIPHHGDAKLFWDRRNWARRCAACHGAKTRREA